MQFEQRILSKFTYGNAEWRLVKIFTAIYWLWVIARSAVLNNRTGQPYPQGICRFFDFSILVHSPYLYIVLAVAAVLLVLYIREMYMIPVLLALSLISVIILALEKSAGTNSRDELCSLIFIAQAIAYIRYSLSGDDFKGQNEARNIAMFYSIQFIAATYTMAAISKLEIAGLNWVIDSPNIVAALYKIIGQLRTGYGIAENHTHLPLVVNFINQHPNITRMFFGGALLIEIFPIVALFGKRYAQKYGLLIILLHLGSLVFTLIIIPTFVVYVTIYMTGFTAWLIRKFSKKQPIVTATE